MTWNEIIDAAFVDLGTIQPGMSITTAMRTDAQKRLNQLLSSLSTEGLSAFNQVKQPFQLLNGITAYTLGSGGTFGTTGNLRALRVTSWRAYYAGVLHDGGPILPLDQFGAVAKQANGEVSAIPKAVGADTSYPLINVRVFPPPSSAPGTLELAYWTPITQVADFTVAANQPEGWEHMLHFNLAVALAPQYARQGGISPELAANAQNSKASLVSQNAPAGPPAQQAA